MESLSEVTSDLVLYLQNNVVRILLAIIVFFIAIKIIKIILKFVQDLLKNKGVEKSLAGAIISFTKYFSYLILLLILASFLGIDTTSLLMLIIILAAVVVIAMQTTLANIGAGIVLLVTKPFNNGNYVEINGKEGYVKENNLYHTLLTQRDNSVVYVPNSEVLNSEIINMDKNRKRRVDIEIYVSNNSDFDLLRKISLETTKNDPKILDNPKPNFIVEDIKPYGTKVRTNIWVKKHDYWEVLYKYNEKILITYKNSKIEFPSSASILPIEN